VVIQFFYIKVTCISDIKTLSTHKHTHTNTHVFHVKAARTVVKWWSISRNIWNATKSEDVFVWQMLLKANTL